MAARRAGAKGDTPNDKPTLSLFPAPAAHNSGAAVVIIPGGGYGAVGMEHEGYDVARWFNTQGVSAFVLNYRHAGRGYHYPAPIDDGQRAVRTVRARAAEWHVDPHQVGVIGFSAGGHLASTIGTHFDEGKSDAADPIQRVSSRPDFLILVYAVIEMRPPYTHGGTRQNLLGDKPDEKLVENLSNDLQVTPQTPPTFLLATSEDTVVPAENSVLFYLALRKAKVPAELHVYERGPHGFDLASKDPVLSTWTRRLADWLRIHGWAK